MEWSVLATILSTLFGGGAVAVATLIINRKAVSRKADAEADLAVAEAERAAEQVHNEEWQKLKDQFAQLDAQLDRMNEQIEFKDKRIMALNEEIDRKEQRFIEQTKRLREVQDREQALAAEFRKLSEEHCELQIKHKDTKCIKLGCLSRKPENEHTRRAKAMKYNKANLQAEEGGQASTQSAG